MTCNFSRDCRFLFGSYAQVQEEHNIANSNVTRTTGHTLLTGVKLDFTRDYRLSFSSYAQIHEEPAIIDSNDIHTLKVTIFYNHDKYPLVDDENGIISVYFDINSNSISQSDSGSSITHIPERKEGWEIKGCACLDERKQRDILSKEYASSPTVSIDAVILTSVLDAAEKGDVVITNIHGDYLTTEIDEELHLILQGDGRVNGANGVKNIPYLRVY